MEANGKAILFHIVLEFTYIRFASIPTDCEAMTLWNIPHL